MLFLFAPVMFFLKLTFLNIWKAKKNTKLRFEIWLLIEDKVLVSNLELKTVPIGSQSKPV